MKFRIKNRVTNTFVSIPATWEDAAKLKKLLDQSSKDKNRYEIVEIKDGIKGWDDGKNKEA